MHDYRKEIKVVSPWQKSPTIQAPWSKDNKQVSKEEVK